MINKTNEELLYLIYDNNHTDYALEQLIHNLRPMMIKIGHKHLYKVPLYDEDDYIQEGSIVLWSLIQKRRYNGHGNFSTLFYTAFDRKCINLYRDYVLRNMLQISEGDDLYDYGYHISLLIEDEYAKAYREKHKEYCKKRYEKSILAEQHEKKPALTMEEKKERARQRSREYYEKNKEKCREAKRKWYAENREYALRYQKAYEQGVRIGQKGPAKKRR